uniref:F-box associated domain-containing protein n=1 Tax=Lactuca sativa TaxID=4236 RepID=A0A9R1XEA8_LACSA|nr:hypothetical protein LSAT_V11C400221180 [Lactuca sativa]
MAVMTSNPLHFKIIRLSTALPSDMLKDKVNYDYFHIELFSSTTWEWREFRDIKLSSSVFPVCDETVISGCVVYFLLSNDTICDLIYIRKNI